ncbi:deoxynucleoside kinase [Exilibacterium tricleocarpae]|uniref:Deoxynucleoside kinase n=1 Tax=Exilibacterium tricleocarpae TaxID=2591008 RepID=A0A545STM9_9GAMM|nr:deoxynucleoside kinase [Exilibacterium tricleocarpae]TQV68298.1 deoxynucleoside kinase [Exilibacterium tricleocarpae]
MAVDYGFDLHFDFSGIALPRYIAIEGPIGVGKTTLAKHLAHTFNYETLLEQAEANPFLERFYTDPRASALPTQLFFLFQRSKQLQALRQADMFAPVRVADFLLEKDPLFAQVTLDDDELRLYNQVYEQITVDAPTPDLVIFLQAPIDILLDRIRKRGVAAERHIDADYLASLNDAYTRFFHYYDSAPLLIVNATEIDLAGNAEHYAQLVEYMLTINSGRHYYNPHHNQSRG